MKRENSSKRPYNLSILLFISFLTIVDQLSKIYIVNSFNHFETLNFFSFINITFVKNFGGAFNLFNDPLLEISFIFTLLTTLICLILFIGIFTDLLLKNISNIERFLWAMILAGGLGNVIDRYSRGYVVDFIDITFNPYIFNFADCYVTLGVVFLILYSFKKPKSNDG
mgnify:FL=1